ncbi:MAG: YfdX family protein [Gammaproteobacteria bacterium]|jgi:soluble cytochrome b562
MNVKYRKHVLSSTAIAILGMLPFAAMAITETVETMPFAPVKQDEIYPLAMKVNDLMGQIATARDSLQQGKPDKANTALDQASKLLKDLDHQAASGRLSVWITSTHKALDANREDREDAYYDAGMTPLRRLDTAKADLRLGRLDQAKKIIANLEYPLAYAEISVPLHKLQSDIDKAQSLLKKDNSSGAVRSVMNAQYDATADADFFGGDFRGIARVHG